MILADKIIMLRKKNGCSQEELAHMLGVSRQAVSKWESAQATPELNRIIDMSQIFSVSTDFLIKDDMEDIEYIEGSDSSYFAHKLSLEEAHDYIQLRERAIRLSAIGIFLLVQAPIVLIGLDGAVEAQLITLTESAATMIGLSVLLISVATAVGLFLIAEQPLKEYEFIEKEEFEAEYGVEGMTRELQEAYQPTATRNKIIGIGMLILSPTMLLFNELKPTGTSFDEIISVILLLLVVAFAAQLLVQASSTEATYEQLLQEGSYKPEAKKKERIADSLVGSLWLLVVAIYIGYSLWTNNWQSSWIIFPVAAVLTPIIYNLVNMKNK